MQDMRYGVHLAKAGWAVYEIATSRLIAIDGIRQTGLKFGAAEQTACRLNAERWADRDAAPSETFRSV